jgi:hypothetical protein
MRRLVTLRRPDLWGVRAPDAAELHGGVRIRLLGAERGYPMVGHVRLDRRQRALTDECSWTQPLMEGTCFNVETSDLVVAFALSEPKTR